MLFCFERACDLRVTIFLQLTWALKAAPFTMPTWVSRGATLGSHCGMSSIYVKVQTAVRFFEFKFYVTNAGLNGDTSSTGKRVQQVVLSWCQQSMVNRGNCAIFAHPYGTLMR